MTLTDYLAAEATNYRVRRKLTEAEAWQMIAEYQAGANVQALNRKWGIPQERFRKILAAAGVQPRRMAESIALWHEANGRGSPSAGSEAQQNAGFVSTTPATVKPPTHRQVEDVPCGWDGVERVVVKVGAEEQWCAKCGETIVGGWCYRCGDNGDTVRTVDVLRDGEFAVIR